MKSPYLNPDYAHALTQFRDNNLSCISDFVSDDWSLQLFLSNRV